LWGISTASPHNRATKFLPANIRILDTAADTKFFKPVFPEPYSGTHHGFSGQAGDNQIDWIMYRGNLKPVKWGIIRDKFAGLYPSDHFPLYAVFEL
jgi:endonuclease/exonuclease/phosphatase family metal-dependent hydrolase